MRIKGGRPNAGVMKKRKRRKRDPRINTHSVGMKDFLFNGIAFVVVSGCHIMVYDAMRADGSGAFAGPVLFISLIGYIALMTLIFMGITVAVRRRTYTRPMEKLGEAARRVADGDFSIRIPPMRKDGKKDYMEVLIEDFNTMAEELSGIETLQTDFIANVSHEIKTPLSVIQSYATALQNDKLSPDERREYADTIKEASQKLSTLVTNILRLNKLENQEIITDAKEYDLSEQLRGCALALEELWEEKDIEFHAELLDSVMVHYNENMLEIVWNNLISNAIKFTKPGGRIALRQWIGGGHVLVAVEDTGCGMDESVGQRIFDKFYQGDTSHSQQGNGLGLALVKRVIDIVGGGITVDSKVGQGSTFTVTLESGAEKTPDSL